MKRTGFRRPTYEEVIEKQRIAREKKRLTPKEVFEPTLKVKVPKTKEERVKSLKTKLWKQFSLYIRKSYADPETGMLWTVDGVYKHWSETHCGHLFNNSERSQSLGGNKLWYDERNFGPQSSNGNTFNANDSAKTYMMYAVRKYGIEAVEQMKFLKNEPVKFTEEELQAKYLYYKNKFDTL